jgi:hypothetical protein
MIIFPGALEANFNAQFRDAYYLGEPLCSTVTQQKRQRSRQDRSSWYFGQLVTSLDADNHIGSLRILLWYFKEYSVYRSEWPQALRTERPMRIYLQRSIEAPVLSGRSKYAKRWRRWAMTHIQADLVHCI